MWLHHVHVSFVVVDVAVALMYVFSVVSFSVWDV